MVRNKITIRDPCQGLKDGQGIELNFTSAMRFDGMETEESFPEHNCVCGSLACRTHLLVLD